MALKRSFTKILTKKQSKWNCREDLINKLNPMIATNDKLQNGKEPEVEKYRYKYKEYPNYLCKH